MSGLPWTVCAVILTVVTVCHSTENGWAAKDYPNPRLSADRTGANGGYAACKRPERSYICDPDNILSSDEANQIDVLINKTMYETTCPCSLNTCRTQKTGYVIGVALVRKMQLEEEGELDLQEEIAQSLDQSRLFAYTLEQTWGLGQCEEDIIIFFSLEDNALYTMTGDTARLILDARYIGEISMKNRSNFAAGKDIAAGVMRMIDGYRDAVQGNYQRMRMEPPKVAALTDASTSLHPHTTYLTYYIRCPTVVFTALAAIYSTLLHRHSS